MDKLTRREFGAATAAGLILPQFLSSEVSADADGTVTGPMIGHVSPTTAHIWYRPVFAGAYTVHVKADDGDPFHATAVSEVRKDLCITWKIQGLQPATHYHYRIENKDGETVAGGEGNTHYFETAPDPSKQGKFCLAFGSCSRTTPLRLWTQIQDRGAQGLVLLGDTPYIDSTVLDESRHKHRAFLKIPQLSKLRRTTPTWATWDDHDFGKNDSDGTLPGKENSRQAFVEYRSNESYGHSNQGIYTKFRYGAIEVFLLDTRWFARTEPSPVDASKPTLLGAKQWDWLQKSLKESTATFKIIACGMIWDDKENGESDDWGTYTHERTALFEFLGANDISGVLLIGGDIHCSRLLQYKTEEQVGYAIRQCIVSPIHNSTIPSLNVAHPDLIHGAAIPHVWLRVEVNSTVTPATLVAEWVRMDRKRMWSLSVTEDELKKV